MIHTNIHARYVFLYAHNNNLMQMSLFQLRLYKSILCPDTGTGAYEVHTYTYNAPCHQYQNSNKNNNNKNDTQKSKARDSQKIPWQKSLQYTKTTTTMQDNFVF